MAAIDWRHSSPSQIAVAAFVGSRTTWRFLRLCACARASWPATSEARFSDMGGDGRLAEGRAGDHVAAKSWRRGSSFAREGGRATPMTMSTTRSP